MSPDAFGELREADDLLDDMPALRNRMSEDGYLLLRCTHSVPWLMGPGV